MDIRSYLARIGFNGSPDTTADSLRQLAVSHQRSVPFENFDNHLLRPVSLEIDDVYEKVVRRRRGGGCYELNGLFGTLLRNIGFRVDFLSGYVFGQDYQGRAFDHLTLRVYLEHESVLTDVGFGDGFFYPVVLSDGASSSYCDREYRLEQNENDWILLSLNRGKLDKGLRFSLQPREMNDFARMNKFHSRNPMSLRSLRTIATRATESGRIALVANTFVERTPDGRSKQELDPAACLATLRDDFGIEIPYFPKAKSSRISMRLRRKAQRVKDLIISRLKQS